MLTDAQHGTGNKGSQTLQNNNNEQAGGVLQGTSPVALPNTVGLGVDIVDIARMEVILKRTPSFARRVFSEEERAYCEVRAVPAAHFAARFAAKEAVLKALGTGFSQGIGPRDVEVRRNAAGRPYVVLAGRAKEVALEQGITDLPLSLSHTRTEAVACALALDGASARAAAKRVDVTRELSQRFKELRSMLDEDFLSAASEDSSIAGGQPAGAESADSCMAGE